MEEAKFVVEELNKIFKTDYNMLSLDSKTRAEVLQLICDVLNYLDAMDKVVVTEETIDQVIFDILQKLSHIKYEPVGKKDPIEFRNGLAKASRNVVHPLLFWLLSNKKQVKERAYVARYVEKVEVLPEILQDPQVASLYAQYNETIQEFWKVYETFKIQRKNASETNVLQSDIKKMVQDTRNISHLLQKQKEKVDKIANKETMLVSVKIFLQEVNRYKKLDVQLKQHSDLLKNMENEIQLTTHALNQEKFLHPPDLHPIEVKEGELHVNKMIVNTHLPREKMLVNDELDICEYIATEPEPQQQELDKLVHMIELLNVDVKLLVEKKMIINNAGIDKLIPFRNQATIISNRKQKISSAVVELKSAVDDINNSINEKKQILYNLVGGEVLHGEELKQFIGKLRECSVVYKQLRAQFNGMSREFAILSRTFDILMLKDNSLEEFLSKMYKKETICFEVVDDFSEAKIKSKKLAQELENQKSQAGNLRDQLIELRTKVDNLEIALKQAKEEFEQATGFISTDINNLEAEKENIERKIKEKENLWNTTRIEVEKLEQTLLKLSEEIISSVDVKKKPTVKEVLTNSLNVERKREEKLKMCISNIDQIREENESNMEATQKIILIVTELLKIIE